VTRLPWLKLVKQVELSKGQIKVSPTPIIGDMGISLEPPNHPQPLYLRGICIQLTPETRSRRKEEKVADKDMVTQEERSVVFSWEKQSCNKCSTFSCWFN